MAIGNHLINSVGFEVQPNCGHFLFLKFQLKFIKIFAQF